MGTEIRDSRGLFLPGNPGKPLGAKSERLKQWDQLAESIVGEQAVKFCNHLNELWESDSMEDRNMAAELYLKTLEYFKPKYSRMTLAGDANEPVTIIIPPSV